MSESVLNDFWQFNFPPFFTIQPNIETRKVQMEAWTSLILTYCKNKRVFKLDVSRALQEQPFQNPALSRGLNQESLETVFEYMREKGKLEWIDKNKGRCFLLWHSPSEWANMIHSWAAETGHINSVCTFYEIISSDETRSLPFHNMDPDFLRRCLKILEKEGKAVIISAEDDGGVKFL